MTPLDLPVPNDLDVSRVLALSALSLRHRLMLAIVSLGLLCLTLFALLVDVKPAPNGIVLERSRCLLYRVTACHFREASGRFFKTWCLGLWSFGK